MRSQWFLFAVVFLVVADVLHARDLPIFDAHIHYNQDARADYTPAAVIAIFDGAGIVRALGSSTPNDGTLALYEKYPTHIVPLLRPYRTDLDRGTWFRNEEIEAYIRDELKRGIYRGIGEFHLYAGQAQTPVMRRIVNLAVERDLPLCAHSDAGAIHELFALKPGLKIVWAHAGLAATAPTVGKMLDRYRGLWIELSLRADDIAPGGKLDPAWRALFLRHPDRFMLGTDTWTLHRWEDVHETQAIARRWLAQLPHNVAEKIAHLNGTTIFPLPNGAKPAAN